MRNLLVLCGFAALVALAPISVQAQDFTITITDHRFTPSEIKVPRRSSSRRSSPTGL